MPHNTCIYLYTSKTNYIDLQSSIESGSPTKEAGCLPTEEQPASSGITEDVVHDTAPVETQVFT